MKEFLMKGQCLVTVLSLGLGLSLKASAQSPENIIKLDRQIPTFSVPIKLTMEESMATNADLANSSKGNTFSHGVGVALDFNNALGESLKFEMSPDLKGVYVPGEEIDLSTFTAKNKISLIKTWSDFTSGTLQSKHGYINNFSHNDRLEFIKNQYYFVGLDAIIDQKISSAFSTKLKVGSSFEDYTTPSSATNPNENDNLRVYAEMTPTIKLNENSLIKLPFYQERFRARTKKSLLSTGAEGGELAETQDYTKMRAVGEFKLDGLTLTPQYGYHKNTDLEHGGKDFRGAILGVKFAYDNHGYGFSSEVISTDQDYKNQLSDVSSNSSESPLYQVNILQVNNKLLIKKIMKSQTDLSLEHNLEQTSSNRSSIDYTNHVFKIKLTFTI